MQLLIDGDVLAHIACKSKWERAQIYRKIPVPERTFKAPEDFDFTDEEANKYLKESWAHFEYHLKSTLERFFCDYKDFRMAMKGVDNFRDTIYDDYKGHRKESKNPNEFVQIVRDMSIMNGLAVPADGMEADDLLRIWAEEAKAANQDFVICSIDKDLKMIPGNHYNVKTNELTTISEGYALRLYYEQMLKGDPTDKIPGLPGIGDKKAEALLANYNTEEEFQKTVVACYQNIYEHEWKDYLLANGKMIHLMRWFEDYFTLEDWAYEDYKVTEVFVGEYAGEYEAHFEQTAETPVAVSSARFLEVPDL